jgi:methionyl-tRNA synthetase
MREISFGQDGSFSWESMTERHNADLANGLGNLASRVLAMLASNFDGVVPEPVTSGAESDLPSVIADALGRYDEHMVAVQLQPALVAVWDIVARANHYLVEKEPWKLAKDPANRDELASVLYAAADTLRVLAIAIAPIMPAAAMRLWQQLGVVASLDDQRLPAAGAWGGLTPGTRTSKGESLFPRLEAG